jgi:thymidylate synthase
MEDNTKDFSRTWLELIAMTLHTGRIVSPRGMNTKELPQYTTEVDMRYPVLRVPDRNLSYRFMVAEAFWILSGDDRVATIAPYNSRIANFSDDGEQFFGAYGPKIKAQLPYVIAKLTADNDTRQAGMTIWRENPPATKDVPCTVAIFFAIRNKKLNCHVFMRSSDQWLGLPYDVFNFSMLSHLVCGSVNEHRLADDTISPGQLYLTAASSHIYETNWDDARTCIAGNKMLPQPETDKLLWNDPRHLMETLEALRDAPRGSELRWWEKES